MDIISYCVLGFLVFAYFNTRGDIANLRFEIDMLKKGRYAPDEATPAPAPKKEEVRLNIPSPAPPPPAPTHIEKPIVTYTPAEPVETPDFEQQFGARLPVWIGGIALAFAGFYMVKYSIETGLLSPAVRCVLGVLLGGGLNYATYHIRSKPDMSDGARISQALSGAGIAVLYIAIYAATNVYELVPSLLGFIGMALVTALAVSLSLLYGAPIALLGLVGGFFTPALMDSNNPNAASLFIYLYVVLAGLMVVIRKKSWWFMAPLTIIGAFLWVMLWIYSNHFSPTDSLWLGLFILATSFTMVACSHKAMEENQVNMDVDFNYSNALNMLTLGGAVVLMAMVSGRGGFGAVEWGLFGLLSAGAVGLAYFKQALYGRIPLLAMGTSMVMLVAWHGADVEFAVVLCAFAALFIASGYVFQLRAENPLQWAGLISGASLGYFLIGYGQLRHSDMLSGISLFWGSLAVLAALASTHMLRMVYFSDAFKKQELLAVYAALTTAFVSLGLTIELPREFLSVAIAVELAAIAWISTHVKVDALRKIAGVLACVFAFLLLPQLMLLVQLTAYSLVEAKLHLQHTLPIVNWPVFQLGLPAVFFGLSSLLLRKERDDRLVQALEVSAVALLGVMGYYLMRHAFHIVADVLFVKAGFLERGVITNVLFAYGIACLWLGARYHRAAVSLSGLALSAIAAFRIFYFDLLLYNPLWTPQSVGALPLANALLITYGLPMVWVNMLAKELPHCGKESWCKYSYGFLLLLGFVFISFNVRQLFHGSLLYGGKISNAEIYSYSVVWLLMGIGLLFVGTLKNDKMIRTASLVLMIGTVGKVFLYDASELEGLFRVFSFFGLGICLIGLSWFYTRFVFTKEGDL